MIFDLLWQASTSLRKFSLRRSEYEKKFWSANKINFDPVQMPQSKERRPDRLDVAIVELQSCKSFSIGMEVRDHQGRSWNHASVLDAMYVGTRYPQVIRKHKEVLVLGSLGPVSFAPACDLGKFCPALFVFSDHRDASVSLGIERVDKKRNGFVSIPGGTKILVWSRR